MFVGRDGEEAMNDRFPFLIAAFVYLMDQYKQLGMVPPEEEQDEEKTSGNEVGETASEKENDASAEAEKKSDASAEAEKENDASTEAEKENDASAEAEKENDASAEAEKKPTLHRGEAILSLNAVSNFECSLTRLNYSQETSDMLANSLNSVFGRVKASTLIIHTSFAQLTTYFVLQEVQNLRSPLDAETEHMLKVLSMALMKTLYLWGVEVACDVEFRRKWDILSSKR